MTTARREDLIRKAEEVRSHMLETLEEFERKSHERIAHSDMPGGDGTQVRTEGAQESPERQRLQRKADRVRNHMIDNIEELEVRARERIVPVALAGAAAMFLLTVGFGFLLYRAIRS
jgi:hypothetical protein